jgi:hypothetical protein
MVVAASTLPSQPEFPGFALEADNKTIWQNLEWQAPPSPANCFNRSLPVMALAVNMPPIIVWMIPCANTSAPVK